MITQERLKELLDYDEITGVFTWKVYRNSHAKFGVIAGGINQLGYLHLGIDRAKHMAHRMAWLYVYGVLPKDQIDHIDGNIINNALSNLREVSNAENQQNQRNPKKTNSTGFLGVSKIGKRFQAQIKTNQKQIYLGLFDTPEEAYNAYLKAKREFHPFNTL